MHYCNNHLTHTTTTWKCNNNTLNIVDDFISFPDSFGAQMFIENNYNGHTSGFIKNLPWLSQYPCVMIIVKILIALSRPCYICHYFTAVMAWQAVLYN